MDGGGCHRGWPSCGPQLRRILAEDHTRPFDDQYPWAMVAGQNRHISRDGIPPFVNHHLLAPDRMRSVYLFTFADESPPLTIDTTGGAAGKPGIRSPVVTAIEGKPS